MYLVKTYYVIKNHKIGILIPEMKKRLVECDRNEWNNQMYLVQCH